MLQAPSQLLETLKLKQVQVCITAKLQFREDLTIKRGKQTPPVFGPRHCTVHNPEKHTSMGAYL